MNLGGVSEMLHDEKKLINETKSKAVKSLKIITFYSTVSESQICSPIHMSAVEFSKPVNYCATSKKIPHTVTWKGKRTDEEPQFSQEGFSFAGIF